MQFITRNLESDPGMSQKEALVSLQKHASFVPGTIIAGLRRRNDRWVAELMEPKTAGEPPFTDDDGDDNAPSDGPSKEETAIEDELGGDAPSDDEGAPEGLDGPPSDDEGSEGKEPKGNVEEQILHTLQQLLHAVQGGGDLGGGMGGPDALGPGPDGPPSPPPPKAAPPIGGKGPVPKPMKPGMTPPGGTPIGAPAFASTKEATPSVAPAVGAPGAPAVPSGAAGPVGPNTAAGTCPSCGYPEPCPMHGGAAAGGLAGQVAAYSKTAATITLHADGDSVKEAVLEARPVVEAHGYQVKQAKRGDGQVHILATRR